MSKYRHWAVLASVGALASACELGLEERACSVSAGGEGACMEGWSCCEDNICRRDCADTGEPDETGEPGGGQLGTSPHDDDPPPTPVRVEVGPGGGEVVFDEASLRIPEGALAALTPIELGVVTTAPLALPSGEQASRFYFVAPVDTSFALPATLEVPVDAAPSQFMMVLELSPAGWRMMEEARYNSQPESETGTVSWTTQRGGIFVVLAVAHRASMALAIGDTPYTYGCDEGGRGAVGVGDPNGGVGPSFSTQNTSANAPECPWPATEPGLWLDVIFRNFVASDGLPLGSWDLAAPESILPLRVRFIASVEEELPVGAQRPYQYYDSTTPVEGADGPIPDVTYQGFYQSPLASGSVRVSRLPTVENTGYSTEAEFHGRAPSLYQISLSNVTLGATAEGFPNSDEPYPPTLNVASASLVHAF